MLKPQEPKIVLSRKEAGEIQSSGPSDFIELLRATLNEGRLFRFRAKGFSMSPFIRDNDVITLAPLGNTSPRVGDIVAFVSPSTHGLMVHRVMAERNDSYLIRGDHASTSDGLIPNINILGRVTRIEREGKGLLLGLGPERFLIAFAVRMGLFSNILLPIWRGVRHLFLISNKRSND